MMNKKLLIIITAVFFALLFAANILIFNFVLADPAFITGTVITWIAVAVLSFIIALYYGALNKAGSAERRKISDYFKRILLIIAFMTVFSFAISFAGGIVMSFIMMIIRNSLQGEFMNGAAFVIPLFMLYLLVVYKTFATLGFTDSRKKVFNLRFKILILLLALMFVMPWAIQGNMCGIYYLTGNPLDAEMNVRAIFSTTIDLISIDHYGDLVASNSIPAVIIKVLLTFAIEMAAALFGYIRGKKAFIKKHMSRDKDYQTDEIF